MSLARERLKRNAPDHWTSADWYEVDDDVDVMAAETMWPIQPDS